LRYIVDIVNAQFFDHFLEPRNTGIIEDADSVVETGDPVCGDFLVVSIKVADEKIDDIRFLCKGCSAAIATSSAMTEMAKGKSLDEAAKITPEMIESAVGGLPDDKRHCSNLGAGALGAAIENYRVRRRPGSGAGDV